MPGCIIPNTPIAVDLWRTRQYPTAKLFFLTHAHADHTEGLKPSWSQKIYCTEVTKQIIMHKLQIRERLIQVLEVNASHIINLDMTGECQMTVSVIDANHCPGAVMFLFQGYFGTVLHTGDFRYTPDMFIDTPLANPQQIDLLYLDNTYCSPECKFPDRQKSMQDIVGIIEKHPDYDVIIGVRNLGKEDLLVHLARHFKTWIVVRKSQYDLLRVLEYPNVFTADEGAGFITAVPLMQITTKYVSQLNEYRKTIAILPTCLYTGSEFVPFRANDNMYIVTYSDHSSYDEMHQFVSKVKPNKINPVVPPNTRGVMGQNTFHSRANMKCFDGYLSKTQDSGMQVQIPESVAQFMNSGMTNCEPLMRRKLKRKLLSPNGIPPKRNCKAKGVVFSSPATDLKQVNSQGSELKTIDLEIEQDNHQEEILNQEGDRSMENIHTLGHSADVSESDNQLKFDTSKTTIDVPTDSECPPSSSTESAPILTKRRKLPYTVLSFSMKRKLREKAPGSVSIRTTWLSAARCPIAPLGKGSEANFSAAESTKLQAADSSKKTSVSSENTLQTPVVIDLTGESSSNKFVNYENCDNDESDILKGSTTAYSSDCLDFRCNHNCDEHDIKSTPANNNKPNLVESHNSDRNEEVGHMNIAKKPVMVNADNGVQPGSAQRKEMCSKADSDASLIISDLVKEYTDSNLETSDMKIVDIFKRRLTNNSSVRDRDSNANSVSHGRHSRKLTTETNQPEHLSPGSKCVTVISDSDEENDARNSHKPLFQDSENKSKIVKTKDQLVLQSSAQCVAKKQNETTFSTPVERFNTPTCSNSVDSETSASKKRNLNLKMFSVTPKNKRVTKASLLAALQEVLNKNSNT